MPFALVENDIVRLMIQQDGLQLALVPSVEMALASQPQAAEFYSALPAVMGDCSCDQKTLQDPASDFRHFCDMVKRQKLSS